MSSIDQLIKQGSKESNGNPKYEGIISTVMSKDPNVSKGKATAVDKEETQELIQTRAGDVNGDTLVEEANAKYKDNSDIEEKGHQRETTEEEAKTSLSVRGIERLQRTVLEDLNVSSKMLHDFNEFSREKIGDAKKVSVKYCKRIRKIRESLYKTFEKIRILKDKINKMDS
eukprot:CAMPEP_0185263650 /NCGR_PEP_ID=MMETSP1359-20130426/15457_1 /TAXON_ID=552665 /ORGANISM="Bigelowiella longifila, Strain CCMP242" /LENGTH=170 /DNA_ID=CAMNT_0027851313 /DNA_START=87 /DNA_END=599 /DNA_ORIENTATION=-